MLFLDRGYEAPTIEAISELSDGPHATVYRLFSSKRGILKALLAVSIVGDDEALAMADRPPVPSLLANPHPKNQLEGFVAIAAPINSRTAAIYRILVSAAASDPDAAALLRELTRQRQEGQRRIARSLARARALRPVIVVTVPLCRAPGHLRHPAGRQRPFPVTVSKLPIAGGRDPIVVRIVGCPRSSRHWVGEVAHEVGAADSQSQPPGHDGIRESSDRPRRSRPADGDPECRWGEG
jgi:AcrR family transcriptional regulator